MNICVYVCMHAHVDVCIEHVHSALSAFRILKMFRTA